MKAAVYRFNGPPEKVRDLNIVIYAKHTVIYHVYHWTCNSGTHHRARMAGASHRKAH